MCGANLTGGRRSEMEAMVKMFMRGVFIQTSVKPSPGLSSIGIGLLWVAARVSFLLAQSVCRVQLYFFGVS
jgi:hypothetical protein